MDFVGTAQGGGGNFAETKVFDLPLAAADRSDNLISATAVEKVLPFSRFEIASAGWKMDYRLDKIRVLPLQLGHGFHCLFDRCFSIHPMTVIQVNRLHA